MITLDPGLTRRLKRSNVVVVACDPDSLILRNVPADRRSFNKSHTNLMLVRSREGSPFLVCVDEDLEYTGSDTQLLQAFAGAEFQRGWRVLNLPYAGQRDIHETLDEALILLGFSRDEPDTPPGARRDGRSSGRTVLGTFGEDLTEILRAGWLEPTLGRNEEILWTIGTLFGWQARMAVIAGPSGVGKTALIRAVTRELARLRPAVHVLAVDLGAVMAGIPFDHERENVLAALLREIRGEDDTVLAVEHLELAVAGNPRGLLLLSRALDRGARILGTVLPSLLPSVCSVPLARRMDVMRLDELGPSSALEVLRSLRDRISDHHGVGADDGILEAVVGRAIELPGRLPSKAITLLDAAASQAAIAGDASVSLYHVYAAGARYSEACEKQ